MKRKRRQVLFLSLVFLLLLSVFIDMKFLAIKRHKLRIESVQSDRIPASFDGFSIAYFSDVLSDFENLDKSIESLEEHKVELVVFGGNLLKEEINEKDKELLIKKLKNIQAPLGKYTVLGDEDQKFQSYEILEKAGFKLLSTSANPIHNYGKDYIDLRSIDLEHSSFESNENIFEVLIMNDSKLAEGLENKDYDLLLAGKYLGGLVKLPFMEPFGNHSKYYKKRYDLEDKTMILSQGLGTYDLPLRLNTNPETIIIVLEAANES